MTSQQKEKLLPAAKFYTNKNFEVFLLILPHIKQIYYFTSHQQFSFAQKSGLFSEIWGKLCQVYEDQKHQL